jgi:hypothetical protein
MDQCRAGLTRAALSQSSDMEAAMRPTTAQHDNVFDFEAVCTENLNTGVVVMKSAQDGV